MNNMNNMNKMNNMNNMNNVNGGNNPFLQVFPAANMNFQNQPKATPAGTGGKSNVPGAGVGLSWGGGGASSSGVGVGLYSLTR